MKVLDPTTNPEKKKWPKWISTKICFRLPERTEKRTSPSGSIGELSLYTTKAVGMLFCGQLVTEMRRSCARS